MSRTLKGISLESALKLLLSQHDLTFVVDKGVLLITTPAAVDKMVEIRVYDVSDLLTEGDPQQLTSILRLAIDPAKAPKVGGIAAALAPTVAVGPVVQQVGQQTYPQVVPYVPGNAAVQGSVIVSYGKLIVVRASIVEHEAIAALLKNMRNALKEHK